MIGHHACAHHAWRSLLPHSRIVSNNGPIVYRTHRLLQIGLLTQLNYFNLQYGSISGVIPTEVEQLAKLLL